MNSFYDEGCRRGAQSADAVGIGLSACVKLSWVARTEKSFARDSSVSTCKKDFSWTFRYPKRRPEIITHLQQNARLPATENIVDSRGKGTRCARTAAGNEIQEGIIGRCLELRTPAGQ